MSPVQRAETAIANLCFLQRELLRRLPSEVSASFGQRELRLRQLQFAFFLSPQESLESLKSAGTKVRRKDSDLITIDPANF